MPKISILGCFNCEVWKDQDVEQITWTFLNSFIPEHAGVNYILYETLTMALIATSYIYHNLIEPRVVL